MKIPVPEVDERFDYMEDALEQILRLCSVIVDKAIKISPKPFVNDIPAYALVFIKKILQQASTLVKISREREDYNTVCALVRMQADNVAAINLIYNAGDDEEKVLRHLLYVMDGVSERYEMLYGTPMSYDGRIPKDTYDALYKQVHDAIDNASRCVSFCEKEIKKRSIFKEKPDMVNVLISKRNWKYKSIDTPKEQYKWKEMYDMLKINKGMDMFSFFSQYVHGLSISNIVLNNTDDFDSPLSFEFCLLGWLFEFLRKEYEPHIEEYTLADIRKIAPGLF